MESVPEIREILVALAQRYAFRELSYLVGHGVTGLALNQRELARVQQLCAYGQRLFDLDAEDFANADAADGANLDTTFARLVGDELVPMHLVERGELCVVRRQPLAYHADALYSLRPAYRLLLEVIQLRWERVEMLSLLTAVHIAAEYAPLLAWEPYLGHAGDPVLMRYDPALTSPESRWGAYDDRRCPQTRPEKAAASRAMRVAAEPPSGWRAYLDRQHSTVSLALGVCGASCPDPCTVLTAAREGFTDQQRDAVTDRTRIAMAFHNSALVKLRHRAPVGHGFGVPSQTEVAEVWQRTRQSIGKRGELGAAVRVDDGFPLPGLPSLFSAVAGTMLTPDSLVADTADEIVNVLERQAVAA